VRRQTLRDIAALHAVWFRDVANSATPQGAANLVHAVGLAKQQGLKVLLNVVQLQLASASYTITRRPPKAEIGTEIEI
jgi:hypothetical protein